MQPRFDRPNFTTWPDHLDIAVTRLAPQPALPKLVEAEGDPVASLVDEPLVPIRHRRIRTLANYWHGGWAHAIAETYVRAEVSRRLSAIADGMAPRWGLAIFDAWRPLALQQVLFDAAYADPVTEPGFMAPVSHDPSTPPPHLTGGAVDLTLTFDGKPLALGTGFDDTTSAAHTASFEGTEGVPRELRRHLYHLMHAQGFVVYQFEWWHFEYGTRRWAAITGQAPIYRAASPAP